MRNAELFSVKRFGKLLSDRIGLRKRLFPARHDDRNEDAIPNLSPAVYQSYT